MRVLPHKDLSPSSSRRTNSLHSSRGSISSTVSSAYSSPWDFYGALTPSTCRTSAFSVSSSASSYCPPSRSSSIVQTSPQRPSVIRSPSSASSMGDSRPATPSSSSIRGLKRKEEVLIMMIFNDVIIIASESSEKASLFVGKKKSEKTMKVLQEAEGGIGKVAEVKDWSGWQGESWRLYRRLIFRPLDSFHCDSDAAAYRNALRTKYYCLHLAYPRIAKTVKEYPDRMSSFDFVAAILDRVGANDDPTGTRRNHRREWRREGSTAVERLSCIVGVLGIAAVEGGQTACMQSQNPVQPKPLTPQLASVQ